MSRTGAFARRTDRVAAMNEALDRELSRLVLRVGSSQSALLSEMVEYHLGLKRVNGRPGKRIRANVVLLTCEALGHRYADGLWAAAAIELVHNFALVVDDIQDGDDLRRGRPSVWKVWGVNQAINAGVGLEALALRAVVDLLPPRQADRLPRATALLAEAMLALCRGQVLDLQFEQRVDVPVDEYLGMIGLKTASLFECAAQLGGLAAGADDDTLRGAARFGRHLGLAFQVIDDMMGIWGSSEKTGKRTGSDLRNGKKTLPILVGLSGSSPGQRQLRTLVTGGRFGAAELQAARDLLDQTHARATCRRLASEHLAEARLNLFALSERPNWAVRALGEMASTLESGLP